MKKFILSIALFSGVLASQAQVGVGTVTPLGVFHVVDSMGGNFLVLDCGIGIGTTTLDNAAKVEVICTTQEMLIPRMTTAERDAINGGNPAEGLTIFNTDLGCINYWNSIKWVSPCISKQ